MDGSERNFYFQSIPWVVEVLEPICSILACSNLFLSSVTFCCFSKYRPCTATSLATSLLSSSILSGIFSTSNSRSLASLNESRRTNDSSLKDYFFKAFVWFLTLLSFLESRLNWFSSMTLFVVFEECQNQLIRCPLVLCYLVQGYVVRVPEHQSGCQYPSFLHVAPVLSRLVWPKMENLYRKIGSIVDQGVTLGNFFRFLTLGRSLWSTIAPKDYIKWGAWILTLSKTRKYRNREII